VTASEAQLLAGRVLAWQRRVHTLAEDAHPSWRVRWEAQGWPSDPAPAPALGVALFHRVCGTTPPLAALAGGHGALALLPRLLLVPRLVALALAGRPGVLRCCVLRSARDSLAQCLGESFDCLAAMSQGRPSVSAATAHLPPMAWAWVGWHELQCGTRWPARSLRRLVRLGLPAPFTPEAVRPHPGLIPPPLWPLERRLALLPAIFGECAGEVLPC
jgi:hypothetical protein